MRLVTWFSAIAVVPAILVAIFAAVTLNLGMEPCSPASVQNALGNAVNVAQVYVKEHEASIIGDACEIANGIQHDPATVRRRTTMSAPDLLFAKLAR